MSYAPLDSPEENNSDQTPFADGQELIQPDNDPSNGFIRIYCDEDEEQFSVSEEEVEEIRAYLDLMRDGTEVPPVEYFRNLARYSRIGDYMLTPKLRRYLLGSLAETLPLVEGHISNDKYADACISAASMSLLENDIEGLRTYSLMALGTSQVKTKIRARAVEMYCQAFRGEESPEALAQTNEAIQYTKEVITEMDPEKDEIAISSLADCISNVLQSQGRFGVAAAVLNHAIQALQASSSAKTLAAVRLKVDCSELLCKLEAASCPEEFQAEQAEQLLREALDALQTGEHLDAPLTPLLRVECLQKLSDILYHRGQKEESFELSQEAYDVCAAHVFPRVGEDKKLVPHETQTLFNAIIFHVETLIDLEEFEDAEKITDTGLEIAQQIGEEYEYFAFLQVIKGRLAEAKFHTESEDASEYSVHPEDEERLVSLLNEASDHYETAAKIFDVVISDECYMSAGECYYRWASTAFEQAGYAEDDEERDMYLTRSADHFNSAIQYFSSARPEPVFCLYEAYSCLASTLADMGDFEAAERIRLQAETYKVLLPDSLTD